MFTVISLSLINKHSTNIYKSEVNSFSDSRKNSHIIGFRELSFFPLVLVVVELYESRDSSSTSVFSLYRVEPGRIGLRG